MALSGTCGVQGWLAAALGLAILAASAGAGRALEEQPGETDAIKACEERLCTMILLKQQQGDDLSCQLTKTWGQSTLKGGEKKNVKWSFGDARCSADIALGRADVVAALTEPAHTIEVPRQVVQCQVEREGEVKPVTIKVAPKLTFKRGRADKVWINLQDVNGPSDVKATVWAAAKLEDSLGLFHSSMIRSINKFMHRKCAKAYAAKLGLKIVPDPAAKARRKAKADAAAGHSAASGP